MYMVTIASIWRNIGATMLSTTHCGPKCHSSPTHLAWLSLEDIVLFPLSVSQHDIVSLEFACGWAKLLAEFKSWSDFFIFPIILSYSCSFSGPPPNGTYPNLPEDMTRWIPALQMASKEKPWPPHWAPLDEEELWPQPTRWQSFPPFLVIGHPAKETHL